jgi:hypothetical protein
MAFVPGPIFANIVLADEINRTPPKTQSALLEAMQEHRVTVQGRTYKLEEPFFVFATQNPIELEGTYPLPEAQLDRFMFQVIIDYLNEDDATPELVRAVRALGRRAARRSGAHPRRQGRTPSSPGRHAGRARRTSGASRDRCSAIACCPTSPPRRKGSGRSGLCARCWSG